VTPSSPSPHTAPPVVGLTGGIGSGKSSVAGLFLELGVPFVDADIVAREVVEPGEPALDQIADYFGRSVLRTDGTLDRAALRLRVFEDAPARQWLEKCLHPVIRTRMVEQLRQAKGPYVLLVSPLLLETDQARLCERVIVVDVPVETQLERTMHRDANTRDQVERIVAAQMSRGERLAKADEVIDNSRPLEQVAEQVRELHQRLLVSFQLK
jgi:dephospho-CoA kinase